MSFLRLFGRGRAVEAVNVELLPAVRDFLVNESAENTLAGGRLDELAGHGTAGREFSVLKDAEGIAGVVWHGVSLSVLSPRSIEHAIRLAHVGLELGSRYSSIVGCSDVVKVIWPEIAPRMGAPREVRAHQPLMEFLPGHTGVEPHPDVRPARVDELGIVFPAAVDMFREEVGTDPLGRDGGRGYRQRVSALISEGKTYIVRDADTVVFKADVGAVFAECAQIHGVWIDPRYRGQGLAKHCIRAVALSAQRDFAPRVTLYVNDFNERARRAYAGAGFEQIGELATILF